MNFVNPYIGINIKKETKRICDNCVELEEEPKKILKVFNCASELVCDLIDGCTLHFTGNEGGLIKVYYL